MRSERVNQLSFTRKFSVGALLAATFLGAGCASGPAKGAEDKGPGQPKPKGPDAGDVTAGGSEQAKPDKKPAKPQAEHPPDEKPGGGNAGGGGGNNLLEELHQN